MQRGARRVGGVILDRPRYSREHRGLGRCGVDENRGGSAVELFLDRDKAGVAEIDAFEISAQADAVDA